MCHVVALPEMLGAGVDSLLLVRRDAAQSVPMQSQLGSVDGPGECGGHMEEVDAILAARRVAWGWQKSTLGRSLKSREKAGMIPGLWRSGFSWFHPYTGS